MPQARRTRKSPVRRRSITCEESYSTPPRRRSRNVWDNFEQLALIALEDVEEEDDINELNESNVQKRLKRRNRRKRSRSRSQRRKSNDEFDDISAENSSDDEYTPRTTRHKNMHDEIKDEKGTNENAVTLHHNPYFKNKQHDSSLAVLNGKTAEVSSKSRKTLPPKTKAPESSSKTSDYSNAKSKGVIKNLKSDSNVTPIDSKTKDVNKNAEKLDASAKVLISGSQNTGPTTSHATKSKTSEQPKHEELPPPHLESNLRAQF